MYEWIGVASDERSESGVSSAEVDSMEAALGVRFPQDFRAFLEEVGWLDAPDVTVYGASRDADGWGNVVAITQEERSGRLMQELPAHLVPVSPDGMGGHFCLICHPDRPDFGHVVYVDHEYEEVDPQPVTDSFARWLPNAFTEDPWMSGIPPASASRD